MREARAFFIKDAPLRYGHNYAGLDHFEVTALSSPLMEGGRQNT